MKFSYYLSSLRFHAHPQTSARLCVQKEKKKKPTFSHLKTMQEAAVVPPYVAFAVRPNPGFWEFVKVNAEDLSVDSITTSEYLKFKEMIFDENW